MNRKRVKIYIDKINSLHNNILSDEEFSEMEIDLLRSYTQSLYEALSEGRKLEESLIVPEEKPLVTVPATNGEPKPTEKTNGHIKEEKAALSEDVEEIVSEVMEEEVDEDVHVAEHMEEVHDQIEEAIEIIPDDYHPDLVELFEIKEAKELAERLKMLPIKDIKAAMSINEKIFTKEELFDGDMHAMEETMQALNNFNSYDEAKSYLMKGVAKENDWTADEKVKKAILFVQLVKRRYS